MSSRYGCCEMLRRFKRKDQTVEALCVVRVVKPRIGMGVEFIDIEAPYGECLARWIEKKYKRVPRPTDDLMGEEQVI